MKYFSKEYNKEIEFDNRSFESYDVISCYVNEGFITGEDNEGVEYTVSCTYNGHDITEVFWNTLEKSDY